MAERAERSAWGRLEIVRNKDRPTVRDYIPLVFEEFYEMHGDRRFGDDPAILGGVGSFHGMPVTVIGMNKGKNLEENKRYHFAMPEPEGYRKAIRLMKQAEKFGRPVVCLVDTPGANPSVGAEERGQGEAIADSIRQMMRLRTPVVSVILGEAGSGGALALAVADELAMLENAVYSVISPRGCASILWKDAAREQEAAEMLKMTAGDLLRFGVADHIIPEPHGGAHKSPKIAAAALDLYLRTALERLVTVPTDSLLKERYKKFRKIGLFSE